MSKKTLIPAALNLRAAVAETLEQNPFELFTRRLVDDATHFQRQGAPICLDGRVDFSQQLTAFAAAIAGHLMPQNEPASLVLGWKSIFDGNDMPLSLLQISFNVESHPGQAEMKKYFGNNTRFITRETTVSVFNQEVLHDISGVKMARASSVELERNGNKAKYYQSTMRFNDHTGDKESIAHAAAVLRKWAANTTITCAYLQQAFENNTHQETSPIEGLRVTFPKDWKDTVLIARTASDFCDALQLFLDEQFRRFASTPQRKAPRKKLAAPRS